MDLPTEIPDQDGFDSKLFTAPDPKNPRIYVVEDRFLVVDQEPIRCSANDTQTIIWRLDMSQPFVFPDNGAIVLSGDDPLPSGLVLRVVGAQRKVFLCTYTRTRPAIWKYSVRVINGITSEPLITLDPTVHQP